MSNFARPTGLPRCFLQFWIPTSSHPLDKLRVLFVPDYDGRPAFASWRSHAIVNATINRDFHFIVAGNPLHGTDAGKLVKKEAATSIKDMMLAAYFPNPSDDPTTIAANDLQKRYFEPKDIKTHIEYNHFKRGDIEP